MISVSLSCENLVISLWIREIFDCANSAFWRIPASSKAIFETVSAASFSFVWYSSKRFWKSSFSCPISFSRTAAASISAAICALLFSSSASCSSISARSACRPAKTVSLSFFCSVARSKFIFAVFWRMYCSCSFSLPLSISSSNSDCAVLISSKRSLDSLIWLCREATSVSSSSTSRLLARRLLVFLNAPPVMEPPGFKHSPSSVTIRNE